MANKNKFEQFMEDVDKKFADLEALLERKPPAKPKKEEGDFRLLKEYYDEKITGLGTEIASLKEIFLGVKEKAHRVQNGGGSFFREFFLGI